MSLKHRVLGIVPAIFLAVGCAKGQATSDAPPSQPDGASTVDGPNIDAPPACAGPCDQDGDGVPDADDHCPNTPVGQPVNNVGCADSQLTATLETTFPPYGLTFTPTGDIGRAGGLTWTYVGIERTDLFHIYWIVCDDPTTPCGLSLDGPIDSAAEHWLVSPTESDLPNGKLVFTNATHILLADATTPALTGRLTVTIVDPNSVAIPFADVAALHVTARAATYGAEIKSSGYTVTALAEVQDTTSGTWTPATDYYDAAQTPTAGGGESESFDGAFYDK